MGRHRAPSRVRKSIKIISAAAAVAGLAGAFAGYQASSHPQPDPVARSVANYHQQKLTSHGILAAGSAEMMLPGSSEDSESAQASKSDQGSKPATTAKSRRTAKAPPAQRISNTSNGTAASASPSPSPSRSTTASLKAAVRKDIASGNYELAIAQYLVENGYSKAAAAGVAGCVAGESAANPESVGSGGGGLIGWTPIGSAAPNPNIITGNDSRDMWTQLADLLYYNSTEIGQSWVTQLNAISDPVSAADFFSANFEKPAVLYSDVRPSVAQQIFSELGGK